MNPGLAEKFEEKGMRFVGRSEDGERMEIMELNGRLVERDTFQRENTKN